MKIRSGFVSNSSSSSFVVFGAYVDDLGGDDDEKTYEIRERLEEQDIEYYESEDGIVVGVDPGEMKLDETLRQFQIRIADKLKGAGISVKPEDLLFTGGEYYN